METKEIGSIAHTGEIAVIRDILMGHHIAEFERRFAEMEAANYKREQAAQERHRVLEEEMRARFDKLELLVKTHVEELSRQMQEIRQTDKHSLSDLLTEMSNKLKS